jgi:hypothetical protein
VTVENTFNEAHEEIKHLEHLSAPRLKVVMTVTILLITMLATLSGVMAGIWSSKQAEAQTARQEATASALKAELGATTKESEVAQTEDDSIEAGWRSSFLYQESTQVHDAHLKQILLDQQKRGYRISNQIDKRLPPGGDTPAYYAQLQEPVIHEEQLAKARALEGVGWLEKNNEALAVVSMLALALFLVGLALTIASRRIQVGFTALSIAMLLFSGGRLAWIAASPINRPTESCVEQYTSAATADTAGHYSAARKELLSVTRACPTYSDAWNELATAAFDPAKPAARAEFASATYRALATSDSPSAVLQNNAGVAALLNHDLPTAERLLADARRNAPDNPIVLSSCAELAAARGDAQGARADLTAAVDQVAKHGPYYRNQVFFAALRNDVTSFPQAGWRNKIFDQLFLSGKEAEASLDSIGRSTPGSTHGAAISDIYLGPAKKIGGVGGFLTIGFQHSGLRPGDHLAFRFYTSDDTTYQATASEPDVVVNAGSALAADGMFPPQQTRINIGSVGRVTLEVYLNGVFQGQTSYDT